LPLAVYHEPSTHPDPANDNALGKNRESSEENWPTPTIAEVSGGMRLDQIKTGKWNNIQLREKIALMEEAKKNEDNWPTPRAGNPGSRKPGTGGKILAEEAVRTWPTSRASDAEGGRITTEETSEGFRSKREKSGQYFGAKLRDAVEMKKPTQAKLNPNWVEQLMGLPVGWTQLPTEWID